MAKILEIKDAYKYYGFGDSLVKAVDGINLTIEEGEFVVILGNSGSGKSTLFNLIAGVDKLTKGSIIFDGQDITKLSDAKLTNFRANNIGYIFQFYNLLPDLNVWQNITLAPGSNRDKAKIIELLTRLGLITKTYKLPRELSGGEQQRVSIARALNKKTRIILCDEPTGALDYQSGKEVLEIIEEINRKEHKTLLFVTHTKEIAKMADRVVVIRNGQIVDDYRNEKKASASEIEW